MVEQTMTVSGKARLDQHAPEMDCELAVRLCFGTCGLGSTPNLANRALAKGAARLVGQSVGWQST